MPRPLRAEHQVESVSLSSRNVTLTTPSASGLFVSHHLEVQQPSVFDCQGIEAGCAAGSARQGTSQGAAQVVCRVLDGKSPAFASKGLCVSPGVTVSAAR